MKRQGQVEVSRRRRKIADLYLQGIVQADIAERVGVNQSTVSRDLKALQRQWQESALVDIDEAKAQEIAKIDRLEREYWDAWVRSCSKAETVRQRGKKSGDMPAEITAVDRTVKDQDGDPRFLAGVQWCIERRCKILGLENAVGINLGALTVIYRGNIDPAKEL